MRNREVHVNKPNQDPPVNFLLKFPIRLHVISFVQIGASQASDFAQFKDEQTHMQRCPIKLSQVISLHKVQTIGSKTRQDQFRQKRNQEGKPV